MSLITSPIHVSVWKHSCFRKYNFHAMFMLNLLERVCTYFSSIVFVIKQLR